MRFFCFFLCVLSPVLALATASQDLDQFLSSRQVVAQVYFASQSTELLPQAKQQLDQVVSKLQDYRNDTTLIRVEGFASPEGSEDYNLKLSLQRALVVEDYLLKNHQLKVYVFLTGYGEKTETDGKLAEMRRVDVAVYEKNPAAEILFNETADVERFKVE